MVPKHSLNSSVTAAAAAKSLQSCPTLCNPRDGSPPGSPVQSFSSKNTGAWLPLPSPQSLLPSAKYIYTSSYSFWADLTQNTETWREHQTHHYKPSVNLLKSTININSTQDKSLHENTWIFTSCVTTWEKSFSKLPKTLEKKIFSSNLQKMTV